MRIFLGCKNGTNTPAVLEMWVLEVGPGLGKRGKEPTNRWKIEGLLPIFIFISNDEKKLLEKYMLVKNKGM